MYFLYQMRTYLETLNLLKEHWRGKKIAGKSVCLWFDVNFSTLLRYLSDPITVPSQSQHVDHWLLWNGNTHQKVGESCCFSAEGLQMHMWSIRSCDTVFSASEARRFGQTMLRGSVILLTSLVAITRCVYRLKDADGRMWIWNSRQRKNVQTTMCLLTKCEREGCSVGQRVAILQIGSLPCIGQMVLTSLRNVAWQIMTVHQGWPAICSCLAGILHLRLPQLTFLWRDIQWETSNQRTDARWEPQMSEGASFVFFPTHDVWSFLVWSMSDIIWSTCYQWIFRLKFATRLVSFFPSLQLWTVSLVVPLFGQSGLNWKQGSYSQWTFLFWTELGQLTSRKKDCSSKVRAIFAFRVCSRWFFSVCLWCAVVPRYRGFWYWVWANHSVYHQYFWTYSTCYMFISKFLYFTLIWHGSGWNHQLAMLFCQVSVVWIGTF